MAEVLVTYSDAVVGSDGRTYIARACGSPMDDSRWQGWIEFVPASGGAPLHSQRETTQPNRVDTAYWATGLTSVYLKGALERTLHPAPARFKPLPPLEPAFDGPAPPGGDLPPAVHVEAVLNPFSVYRKGETLLRQQLAALASWHLVNIIRAYDLSAQPLGSLERRPSAELIELIVDTVRESSSKSG
jgi:hypothetical protein